MSCGIAKSAPTPSHAVVRITDFGFRRRNEHHHVRHFVKTLVEQASAMRGFDPLLNLVVRTDRDQLFDLRAADDQQQQQRQQQQRKNQQHQQQQRQQSVGGRSH
jgi:hypothetical protein